MVGVDNVASAIDDARSNAALNGVNNATWIRGNAEKVIGDVLRVSHAVLLSLWGWDKGG